MQERRHDPARQTSRLRIDHGFLAPTFGTGRVNGAYNNIIVAESVGTSVYNGLNLTFNKRFGHGLDAFATWTWSHSIDDAPEQNNIDSGAGFLSDVTNRGRDRGNSLTDRRHAFNGNAVWDTSAELSSALAAPASSALPAPRPLSSD